MAVEVVIGVLGEGERVVMLEEGDSLREAIEGPGYVSVTVAEGSDETEKPEVGDTTYEQTDGNGDREWKVDDVTCTNCSEIYPKDYTRCPDCGIPNQS